MSRLFAVSAISRTISFVALVLFASNSMANDYVPGEVIVKYKTEKARSLKTMKRLYDQVGVEQVQYLGSMMREFEQLYLNEQVSVEEAIAELNKNPLVEYAHPNYRVYIPEFQQLQGENFAAAQSDNPILDLICIIMPDLPGCDSQAAPERPDIMPRPNAVDPAVRDPDESRLWGMGTVEAYEAWDIHEGSQDVIVAVIDTGVDYNHEDLAFNMWRNPNPTQGDIVGFDFVHNDHLPYDDVFHGTHVAGTIGATGGNGVGIVGVAPKVSLMALKFLGADGSGDLGAAIRAIDYAIENGAKVLNNSWGSSPSPLSFLPTPDPTALIEAVERSRQAGALFVAAAGNGKQVCSNGGSVLFCPPEQVETVPVNIDEEAGVFPASFEHDNVLTVAASTDQDELTYFSNIGREGVDLAAPGARIYSTMPESEYAEEIEAQNPMTGETQLRPISGTSMASPHVAGAAALLWSYRPDATYLQIKQALMNSADAVSSHSGKTVTGGRLNVLRALRSMD